MEQLTFKFYDINCPYCSKDDKLKFVVKFLNNEQMYYCNRCGIGFGYHYGVGVFK